MHHGSNRTRLPDSAECEIRARGDLNQDWSSRLRGMRITVDRSDLDAPVTVLRGTLPDDAALNGILTTLYALGLSLLSVRSFPASDQP